LGREPVIPFDVVARCGPGHPLVIRNRPLDPDGHPFPTLYWLTCPDAVRAVSRLESDGWIKRLEDEVEVDPELRTRLRRAHEEYARERGRLHPGAEAFGGVGGAARGVKCLHAHYAHTVAGGSDPIGNWVARRLAGSPLHHERPSRRVAAVDLGTNTVRLLVAKFSPGHDEPQELARDMVITRVGKGVGRTGRFDPEALERTVEVVRRYSRRARALGAERIHVAATSAVRDASNREQLAAAVERIAGEPMEILSGEDEARTTFLGATRGLDADEPVLVLDIGGGSTEVALGRPGQDPDAVLSAQVGSVRLTERFVRSDPPSYEELGAVDRAVGEALAALEDRIPVHDARTLVAVAGTATTVQAIALGLPEYDPERIHRTVLARARAEQVFRLLADMTIAERRALPVMAPGREDVIPSGAAILVGAMQRWGFPEVVVSESDILDGLAYRMVEPTGGR
jgi:exopolyphosphatase/guanosine-5'-triphosphate,3'-diphosphate pyrophosphatase